MSIAQAGRRARARTVTLTRYEVTGRWRSRHDTNTHEYITQVMIYIYKLTMNCSKLVN